MDSSRENGFPVGKWWQIRISFTVARLVEHFIIGVGIVSDHGIPVWTVWSTPEDLKPGVYQAVFHNRQVLLCSGSFSIAIGLSTYTRTFQFIGEAGTLVISEVNEVSEAVTANIGFIVNPMSVTISQSS